MQALIVTQIFDTSTKPPIYVTILHRWVKFIFLHRSPAYHSNNLYSQQTTSGQYPQLNQPPLPPFAPQAAGNWTRRDSKEVLDT